MQRISNSAFSPEKQNSDHLLAKRVTIIVLTLYVAVTQFTIGKLRYCYVKS